MAGILGNTYLIYFNLVQQFRRGCHSKIFFSIFSSRSHFHGSSELIYLVQGVKRNIYV